MYSVGVVRLMRHRFQPHRLFPVLPLGRNRRHELHHRLSPPFFLLLLISPINLLLSIFPNPITTHPKPQPLRDTPIKLIKPLLVLEYLLEVALVILPVIQLPKLVVAVVAVSVEVLSVVDMEVVCSYVAGVRLVIMVAEEDLVVLGLV